MIAQWSAGWCPLPAEALGSIPSCTAGTFPLLRPDVSAFFLLMDVLENGLMDVFTQDRQLRMDIYDARR